VALRGIPQQVFEVKVKEYAPRTKMTKCPTPTPSWVANLIKNGTNLNLESVVIQAGRHFSDSLNMMVFDGSATRRQEATKLAWHLISMLSPSILNNKLIVIKLVDQDIKRLTSELIGVGASLELLRTEKIIDARTLRKISSRFDFEANGCNGLGKIKIEAKGTSELVSIDQCRSSFRKKLLKEGLLGPKKGRGYSRVIGIVFSTWTSATERKHDIELLDPERLDDDCHDEAIREIIKFYARRLDETAGLLEGAKRLWNLANFEELFNENDIMIKTFGEIRHEGKKFNFFNRSSFIFNDSGNKTTYWGTFWEGGSVPCPLKISEILNNNIQMAYTGIDRRIFHFIRDRQFSDLLSFSAYANTFILNGENGLLAIFIVSEDGVIQGWMNKKPEEIEYVVERIP
jgi:hypothetical protein